MEIKVEVSELRKCKIFLAAPMFGGNCAGMFSRSIADLSALCTHYGISLQLYFLFNESLITRARNYCVDEFRRSGATHLMFVDSDIGFNANDVLGLLALSKDPDSGFDIIAGPYPKKCISWEKIKMAVDKGFADTNPNDLEKFVGDFVFNPKDNQNSIRINDPVEVREVGTGFMMVQRHVFERFVEAYPTQSYRPDHVRTEHFDGTREIHAFFDCIIDRGYVFDDVHKLLRELANTSNKDMLEDTQSLDKFRKQAQTFLELEKKASKRYLSEDYMFCQLVNRIGLKTWFCPWMKLQHVGTYVFGGSLADLAQIGAPATADAGQLKKNRASVSPMIEPPKEPVQTEDLKQEMVAAEAKRERKKEKRRA